MMCGLVGHAAGTRQIPELGGLAQKMPNATFAMVAASLASLGLPGMAGFVAELQVFIATWDAFGWIIILPIASVAVTAGYYLWALERSFFGPLTTKVETHHLTDWHAFEAIPLMILIVLIVGFGLLPSYLNDFSNPATAAILAAARGGL
jgi:NADH-quinone oxidoreductase subunit M